MSPTGRTLTGTDSEDEEYTRMVTEWQRKQADRDHARAEEDAQFVQKQAELQARKASTG